MVTLSENLNYFVWTGEIRQGATNLRLFWYESSVPHPEANTRPFPDAMPITLHAEKFWEGPEHILDFATVAKTGGEARLVLLLLPDAL